MSRRDSARRRVCVAALTGAALLGTVRTADADWRQFHAGPARLGVSGERSITRTNVDRLKVRWKHDTRWSKEGVNSSPAVANGTVYVGADDGRLYAFGVKAGVMQWSRPTGGRVRSSPAVAGGRVYVGSDSRFLLAFGTRSGRLKWKRDVGGRVSASPLVADGKVFVGSRSGRFVAVDADTGRVLWKRRTGPVWDGAAYRGGTVYVGSDWNRVYAFDADSGRVRWVADVWGRVRSTPAVTVGRAFVGTDKGRVIALDRRTGGKRWNAEAVKPGLGFVRCAPAVAEGRVYVSTGLTTDPMDGKVKAFGTKAGRLLWKADLADYSTSSPVYANGLVFVGSFDHRLYALDADTGHEVWTSGWAYEGGFFRRGISSSPAISGGRVFIGVRDGHVFALGLPG